MGALQKIGDLATKYAVSGRTLRYYEEIGILQSIRDEDSKYRFYDEKAIERLEQILLLRKLQLPVKDIQKIFLSGDISIAVDAFTRKLKKIRSDMKELEKLNRDVAGMLKILKAYGYERTDGLKLLSEKADFILQDGFPEEAPEIDEEDIDMNMGVNTNQDAMDVRIIQLKPMKVASYRAESSSPEQDAWSVILKWTEERGLQNLSTTRYFGFNNPSPENGNPVYGYEVWVTVPEDCEVSEDITIKQFDGGEYAVASTYLHEITDRWQKLARWVEQSEYTMGRHQWLEETISPVTAPAEKMQLDLYCPISKK